jgi:hypothetical protein
MKEDKEVTRIYEIDIAPISVPCHDHWGMEDWYFRLYSRWRILDGPNNNGVWKSISLSDTCVSCIPASDPDLKRSVMKRSKTERGRADFLGDT